MDAGEHDVRPFDTSDITLPPVEEISRTSIKSSVAHKKQLPNSVLLRQHGGHNQMEDISNYPCNDELCTQFLEPADLSDFHNCPRHMKKGYRNGTCRFLNGSSRRVVALASFPGSGNTWVRGLLEKAAGICTGMDQCCSVWVEVLLTVFATQHTQSWLGLPVVCMAMLCGSWLMFS